MGTYWGYTGVIMRLFGVYNGVMRGTSWGHTEDILGTYWGYLGTYWGYKGILGTSGVIERLLSVYNGDKLGTSGDIMETHWGHNASILRINPRSLIGCISFMKLMNEDILGTSNVQRVEDHISETLNFLKPQISETFYFLKRHVSETSCTLNNTFLNHFIFGT